MVCALFLQAQVRRLHLRRALGNPFLELIMRLLQLPGRSVSFGDISRDTAKRIRLPGRVEQRHFAGEKHAGLAATKNLLLELAGQPAAQSISVVRGELISEFLVKKLVA